MNSSRLIELFNKGGRETDKVIKTFGSTKNFIFKYLKPKKLVHKLDIDQIWDNLIGEDEFLFNKVCLTILDEVGPVYFLKKIPFVQIVNDQYYFQFHNLNGLSGFFDDSYNNIFRKFSQEHYLGESEVDFYYDIYQILNFENKRYFKNYMINNFGDVVLNLDDFVFFEGSMKNYLDENGNFEIYNNIDEILSNEDMFNSVLYTDLFTDLKYDLLKLYNYSYQKNLINGFYKRILNSLNQFFYPKVYKGDYLKFVNFENFLRDFFECFSDYKTNIFDTYGPEDMVRIMIYHGCLEEIDLSREEIPTVGYIKILNDNLKDFIS